MKKRISPLSLVIFIFSIIFFIFAIATAFMLKKDIAFYKNCTKSEASISKIEYVGSDDHDVYIDYIVDGEEYNDILINSYSSNWNVGDKITIYYNNDDPTDIMDKGSLFIIPIVFSSLDFSFLLIIVILEIVILKKKSLKKLVSFGERHTATIKLFQENTSVTVNGAHPYRIIAIYDGKEYYSENIYDKEFNCNPQDKIDLYIDSNKPKRYYLDYSKIKHSDYDSNEFTIDEEKY